MISKGQCICRHDMQGQAVHQAETEMLGWEQARDRIFLCKISQQPQGGRRLLSLGMKGRERQPPFPWPL